MQAQRLLISASHLNTTCLEELNDFPHHDIFPMYNNDIEISYRILFMARRNVEFTQGNYYHVYNRGAERQLIFRTEDNYKFLLRKVRKYSIKFSITIIAYCLMPNHYHFLLCQDGDHTISDFIQAVFNSYSKAFNKMYNRSGTLFEGPFKAVLIDNEAYLLHICRYIHRNPLDAGLVGKLIDWPYSNYLEWIGARDSFFIDRAFIEDNFSSPHEYTNFLMEYKPPKMKDSLEYRLMVDYDG